MRCFVCVSGILCLMIAGIGWLTPASVRGAGAAPSDIAHGKYLVERVAMCGDCHTPHDDKGQPIANQTLRGAILPFKATVPMPWAAKSPDIAGLRGWDEAEAIKLLMTGKGHNDAPALPPMPNYRMNKADATAVVHYVRSLSKGGSH
jgi:hypothetical protein